MPEAVPPPLSAEFIEPGRVRRVGGILIAFGFVEIALGVFSIVAALSGNLLERKVSLNFSFGFMVYWIAAWLVFNDKRVIWPLMAYFSALAVGGLLGGVIGLGLGVPLKLVLAVARHSPAWFWYPLTCGLVYGGFFLWLLVESLATRDRWPASFQNRTNPWLQPRRFVAYGLVPCAVFVSGLLLLLRGAWGQDAVDLARRKNGPQYDYMPINYEFRTVNGESTHEAVVLAYSDTGIKIIPLKW